MRTPAPPAVTGTCEAGAVQYNEVRGDLVMERLKVRLVAALAELLWGAMLVLLYTAAINPHDGILMALGLACSAGAAAATVSAVVICVGGKVIRSNLHREVNEVEEYLRRQQDL